jgi:nicotinamidase/pyrazinamidase
MSNKRIYVDVDTQHDFCEPTGALFVQGAPAAMPVCRALIAKAIAEGAPIVGSVDSHAHDAWEFATNTNVGPNGEKPNFPPHCVKGTAGWLKVEGTLAERFVFVAMDAERPRVPPKTQAVYLEKEVYSLFANPNATRWLDTLTADGEPVEFVIFGVATDYCVKAAAIDTLNWIKTKTNRLQNSTVLVVLDAIAPVVPAAGVTALDAMVKAGAKLVSSSELGVSSR